MPGISPLATSILTGFELSSMAIIPSTKAIWTMYRSLPRMYGMQHGSSSYLPAPSSFLQASTNLWRSSSVSGARHRCRAWDMTAPIVGRMSGFSEHSTCIVTKWGKPSERCVELATRGNSCSDNTGRSNRFRKPGLFISCPMRTEHSVRARSRHTIAKNSTVH